MKLSLSSISIWIIAIACFILNFSFNRFERTKDVIKDDVVIYYEYLPLIFIYDDIRIEKVYGTDSTKDCIIWALQTPDGKNVIKMTMGLSILYSPFFFIAHKIAQTFEYAVDGYSQPYTVMLLLSTIFYLVLGLYYVKKTLRHYLFQDSTVAITILLIGLGTNILCYASQSAPMPHVYLFCMISIFLFYNAKWNESASIKNSVILGLTTGLISLIRPTDIIIVILFALYGVSFLSDVKTRTIFLAKKIFPLLIIIASAFVVWLPQFLYWKITTGKYLYYSYNDERFFFSQPRILEGLFSFRKGWLLYTPMMLFAMAGLFLMRDELKKLRTGTWLFILVNFYITFSWWCWWYGGAFGMRSMIDSYAIMALPLASTISYVRTKKKLIRILFFTLAVFFIVLNIFQTYQYEKRILRYDGINRKLYFMIFGKTTWKPEFEEYATSIDAREAKLGRNSIYEPAPVVAYFVSTDTIFIKSKSGMLVSFNPDDNKIKLLQTDQVPGENEIFILKKLFNGQCAITAKNNKYLCADLTKDGLITASSKEMVLWETFSLIKAGNNSFGIKASNGKYISVSTDSTELMATSDTIGTTEIFNFINK